LPYHQEVLLAANETAIEPALIHAVIATESKHNARAKSNKGALGLMQLMPATARRFHVKDRNDPKQNILAGSKYLRELLNLYQGDLTLTLAAYNAGPGAVQKYSNRIPPYKETMRYVPKVLKYYKKYS
jgi:soluble lytic murein transglycosylase-like protein